MVDISNLPEPNFIERNVQNVTHTLIAEYERLAGKPLYPAQADRVFIDVIAYREMLIRNAINEAGKQNLIAFANGVMLDYLGDFFGVARLDGETDTQLRTRIRLAPESYATTGSRQAYIYHTLSTSSEIIDAQAVRGDNGNIYLYVHTAAGTASQALLDAVLVNTSDEKKRPLSDRVHVSSSIAKDFALTVKISPLATANAQSILATAISKANAYVAALKTKLGKDVVPSQIIDALSGDGVWQVQVVSPSAAIIVTPYEWANCTAVNVSLAKVQEG